MSQCLQCDKDVPVNTEYCGDCERKMFSKIGGMLYLPATGLVISLIVAGLSVFQTSRILLNNFTTFPTAINVVLCFELIGFILILLLTVFTALHFFTRRKTLPRLYISLILFNLMFCLIDMYLGYRYLDVNIDYEAARPAIRGIISACIWVPYFLVSERVKKTFIR